MKRLLDLRLELGSQRWAIAQFLEQCMRLCGPTGVAVRLGEVQSRIGEVRSFYMGFHEQGNRYTAIIETVANFLEQNPNIPSVIDPVIVASSGDVLIDDEAVNACQEILIPRATLVTPNIDECEALIGEKPHDINSLTSAAIKLSVTFSVPVLLKGGHLDGVQLYDIFVQDYKNGITLSCDRIHNIDTHGSGCTLSSAIAAHLAHGASLVSVSVLPGCTVRSPQIL